jgi:hypothetical protein
MALDLTTAVGRIRSALGDAADPSLHPDGDAWYAAILALADGNEPTAWKIAAQGLAMYLQSQATSAATGGRSVAYDSRRVNRLLAIAAGTEDWPFTADGTARATTFIPLEVVW